MNKNQILVVALLLVGSMALESTLMEHYAFAFKGRRSIMAVMTQVDETLKNGGPMDAITNILNEFETEIKEEQVAHQSLFDRQTAECEDEFKFRNQQIKEADDAIHEARNTLESCTGQKQRAEKDLKLAESSLSQVRTSLGTLTRKKIQWDYSFETKVNAFRMALDAFPECYRLLNELENGGAALVQFTSHITKMVPTVHKTNSISGMNSMMGALAQLSSQAQGPNDKAAIEKVRSVLINFEEQIKRNRDALIKENEDFQKFFAESDRKMKAEIARLTQLISDLEDEIADLNNCIAIQSANLSSAQAKFSRNDNLLKKAQAMCEAMGNQFEKATASRKDELELLGAIKIKVMERYGQISKGAAARGEMSKEQLGEYDELKYEKKSFGGI